MPVQLIRTRGLAAIVISVGTLAASVVLTNAAKGGIPDGSHPRAVTVLHSSTTTTTTAATTPAATPSPSPSSTSHDKSVRWGGLSS
ncbi:MAG: hypothetical protein QOG52_2150 [Frankiaceae bacterium]|nr:hypothetical protein [Frankiaceae bacterium]